MTVRVLLAALLLCGTTGSVVCRAYCAHAAEFAGVFVAQEREHPVPGAAACHGHAEPSPGSRSQPQDSDGPADTGCCPDLWLTVGYEASWTAAQAPAFSSQGTLPAVAFTVESSRRGLAAEVPPGTLRSPFRTQNPPLLI